MVKICLNMIVKNESRVIERMLSTCINIIDNAVILDTGSTDNTKELICNFFKKHNKPCTVYDGEFRNFRHARNLSLSYAKTSNLLFQEKCDYFLFLDADMNLVVKDGFNKDNLTADVYTLKQISGGLSYYNVRLIRSNLDIKVRCVTHEYYQIKNEKFREECKLLYIDDTGDGGSKQNKFTRDRDLFLEAINTKDYEDDDELSRIYFYLANTYSCMNEYDEAIKYYKKRCECGGWNEEKYISQISIGNLYREKKENEKAIYHYLTAIHYSPNRLESIQKIIEIFRNERKYNLIKWLLFLADEMNKNPLPEKDILFKDVNIYNYGLDIEKSINYYYLDRKEGIAHSDKVLLNPYIPYQNKYIVHQNMKFYAKRLKDYQNYTIRINNDDQIKTPYHHYSNPCIFTNNDLLFINTRQINYIIDENNHYKIITNEGYKNISTEYPLVNYNQLLVYDNDQDEFNHLQYINDHNYRMTNAIKYNDIIKGSEDIRLLIHNDMMYAIATNREYNPQHLNQMELCMTPCNTESNYKIRKNSDSLSKSMGLFKSWLHKRVILSFNEEEDKKPQKNWAPFIHNDKYLLVYSWYPLIILEPDIETGKCSIYHQSTPNVDLRQCRGSSQGFYYNNKLYFIVHEVTDENGKRIYYHRFITLDNNFNVTQVSSIFVIDKPQIEYICGACIKDDNLYISYSIRDLEAYVMKIEADSILN